MSPNGLARNDENSKEISKFVPRGYRTRPVTYKRGESGKQSATRYPEDATKPILLLVMDSNGRNIVNPQRVLPSSNTNFTLAAISIPGGKTFHACIELRHLERCHHTVSHVVLALGTNDMSEGEVVLSKFSKRIGNLIRVAQDVYPEAKVSVMSILPRHDEFSSVAVKANEDLQRITKYFVAPYLSVTVPNNPSYWSDFIHLSDIGLQVFLQNFEIEVEKKLFDNPNFKPETISWKRKKFSMMPCRCQVGMKRHLSCTQPTQCRSLEDSGIAWSDQGQSSSLLKESLNETDESLNVSMESSTNAIHPDAGARNLKHKQTRTSIDVLSLRHVSNGNNPQGNSSLVEQGDGIKNITQQNSHNFTPSFKLWSCEDKNNSKPGSLGQNSSPNDACSSWGTPKYPAQKKSFFAESAARSTSLKATKQTESPEIKDVERNHLTEAALIDCDGGRNETDNTGHSRHNPFTNKNLFRQECGTKTTACDTCNDTISTSNRQIRNLEFPSSGSCDGGAVARTGNCYTFLTPRQRSIGQSSHDDDRRFEPPLGRSVMWNRPPMTTVSHVVPSVKSETFSTPVRRKDDPPRAFTRPSFCERETGGGNHSNLNCSQTQRRDNRPMSSQSSYREVVAANLKHRGGVSRNVEYPGVFVGPAGFVFDVEN